MISITYSRGIIETRSKKNAFQFDIERIVEVRKKFDGNALDRRTYANLRFGVRGWDDGGNDTFSVLSADGSAAGSLRVTRVVQPPRKDHGGPSFLLIDARVHA